MTDVEKWKNDSNTIKRSNKQYAHFDFRTDITKAWDYISNPENVARHGFYPFIHYTKSLTKYSKIKEKKVKNRDICYAAHIDRCLFQYYNFLLNERYNQRVKDDGISHVAVAYRTNLGASNIEFANHAIDFIRKNASCYVMIGDFTGFFDNLDHRYLKNQLCNLLKMERLPPDYYAIYKNITQYSIWELSDLLHLNNLKDTISDRRKLNSQQRVITPKQFKQYRTHIVPHAKPFGIPQGSPISALLANVYMLDIDKVINQIIVVLNGLYMRYSDDFIIVIPEIDEKQAVSAFSLINSIFNDTPGLTLQPDKTQFFRYELGVLTNCGKLFYSNADCEKRYINFLGFTFDGKKVSIRAKTISKYYYRMYRKAKTISKNGGHTSAGKRISCRNIYKLYSCRGAEGKRGNFITYVNRAKKEFGAEELINRDTKRHMQKIRKAITKYKK